MRVWVFAAVLAVTVPPADAGPKAGKIVRIERPRTGARGTPRVCQLSPGDNSLSCFGLPPVVGEVANVVATEGVMAQVRITKVEDQGGTGGLRSSCTSNLWRAETELVDSTNIGPNGLPYGSWVIFDVAMLATAKLGVSPPQLPANQAGESVAVALDRDGEDPADFLVTWYPCNQQTANVQTYCVDYWSGGGATWTRQRQDTVTWCM